MLASAIISRPKLTNLRYTSEQKQQYIDVLIGPLKKEKTPQTNNNNEALSHAQYTCEKTCHVVVYIYIQTLLRIWRDNE